MRYRAVIVLCSGLAFGGCSSERHPPVPPADTTSRLPRAVEVETPKQLATPEPYRTKFGNGAELYLPPWFTPRGGHYDLIIHFHGLGKLQEANLEHAQINAAVVSVNHGVGTDGYGNAFRDPHAFANLLSAAQEEIERSNRAHGAVLGRLALSAWSAGFVSVSKILNDASTAERVDAVLLADGFFTSYLDEKRRLMNVAPLEKFARLAESATHEGKLFAITHTTIPTVGYPSVNETVAKLLEMTSSTKVPTDIIGPPNMHAIYTVDRGNFHVKGYQGVLAKDHIRQISFMGETLWPYLKTRWDRDSATDAGK